MKPTTNSHATFGTIQDAYLRIISANAGCRDAPCSPGSELRAGYKIAFNEYGKLKRWRILKIQNGLALVTEGWGVHKIMSVASIALYSYMIEETGFPWYLRPFYRENS